MLLGTALEQSVCFDNCSCEIRAHSVIGHMYRDASFELHLLNQLSQMHIHPPRLAPFSLTGLIASTDQEPQVRC